MRLAFVPLLGLLACSAREERAETPEPTAEPSPAAASPTTEAPTGAPGPAIARLAGVGGHDVQGTVAFEPADGGVRVHAELTGLSPGQHGFHVHETGSCADDAKAAGGHFAPEGDPHAGPSAEQRHVGDLGNIEADADGRAVYDRVDPEIALEGDRAIVGRALVVHERADDLATQPSGDSGGRIACGVIERARPGS